jgi:hypothetical protein
MMHNSHGPQILEFHFTVEKMDKATAYDGWRMAIEPKVTVMDILTDKILIKGNTIQKLLRSPKA